MKKLRRYHRKKILKSIEIGSIAGIIGLCGNLILSPEQSKEISSKSTTATQVNMNEDNLVMNNTEEMIKNHRGTPEHLYFFGFHPIYFYRYLCYNVPKAIAELVFEEGFFNGS